MIPVFKYLYKQLIPGIKKLISPFGIAEWYRQLQTTADINKSKYSDVTIAKYYYIIIIIIERMLLECHLIRIISRTLFKVKIQNKTLCAQFSKIKGMT